MPAFTLRLHASLWSLALQEYPCTPVYNNISSVRCLCVVLGR